jgi:hypothetical protein
LAKSLVLQILIKHKAIDFSLKKPGRAWVNMRSASGLFLLLPTCPCYHVPMIVVDIEGGGLDPNRSALLSIGAVDFNSPDRTFYGECQARKGAELDPFALSVCGFSTEQAQDPKKQSEAELIAGFIAWTETAAERTLAGHNTDFDRNFLQAAAKRAKIPWKLGHRIVDLHTLAYAYQLATGNLGPKPISQLNSDSVYALVGMPPEPKPHLGITGATMEAEAFSRLLYGRGLLAEFAKYPVPAGLGIQ